MHKASCRKALMAKVLGMKQNLLKIAKKIFLVLLTSLFVVSCNKTQKVRLSGFVEATSYNIVSQVQGTALEVLKSEGEKVSKGDNFARLDSKTYEYTVKQQEDIVASKNARLNELVRGARPQEISGAESKVDQAQSAIVSSQKAQETAQINYNFALDKYNDVKKLYEDIKVTEEELKDAKYKLDIQEQARKEANERVNSAKTGLGVAQASYELVISGSSSETIDMAKADLNSSKNGLLGAKSILEKYVVKAPWDGIISTKNVNIGEVVNAGSNIGVILDLKDMYVKLYIPQKYLPKFKLNNEISLNSFSDKNLIAKGKISFVSEKAEFTPRNIETDEAKETTVYMIKVKVEAQEDKIKPGMTMETTFEAE